MKKYIDESNIKFKVKGICSKEDIINNFINFLNELESNCGINQFINPTLYFAIRKNGKKQVLLKNNHFVNEFQLNFTKQSSNSKSELSLTSMDFDTFQKQEEENKILLIKEQRKNEDEYKKRIQEKNLEKENLYQFKLFICKKINIDIKDLQYKTTSIGLLIDKKTICKYLNIQIEDLIYNKLYRVTYREEITKKPSFFEIYDLNHNLILKSTLP